MLSSAGNNQTGVGGGGRASRSRRMVSIEADGKSWVCLSVLSDKGLGTSPVLGVKTGGISRGRGLSSVPEASRTSGEFTFVSTKLLLPPLPRKMGEKCEVRNVRAIWMAVELYRAGSSSSKLRKNSGAERT